MVESFPVFFQEVQSIRFLEPLAQTLGAIRGEEGMLEYTYADVVKMAGHACPTTAGAYLACRKALEKLYPGQVPVRGDISIILYGEADQGVFGVIGQVFSLLTGAAPASGFRGLGHKFKRKDLLRFQPPTPETSGVKGLRFDFHRLNARKFVRVDFLPALIPFSPEKAGRTGQLMEKVLWDAARPEEREEFRSLWMEKVRNMLVEERGIVRWLKIEEIDGPDEGRRE
jgi:formylmethanofuran dehydrogenase subunit E